MHQAPQIPKIAELSWSGTPSGATHTYSMSVDQQTSAFATVSSSTDITLSRGHYYAIALIDCTVTTKDIKLEITDLVSVTNINNNSFPQYASQTRAEIWRFEG